MTAWAVARAVTAQEEPGSGTADFENTVAVLEREIAQLQALLDQTHAARQQEMERKIALAEKLNEAQRENEELRRALRENEERAAALERELNACRLALREAEWVRDTLTENAARDAAADLAEAERLLLLGRVEEAARRFETLAQRPGAEDAKLGLAVCRYRQQRWAEARALAEEVARQRPDDAKALGLLGLLAYRERNFHVAEQHLRRALELSPNDPQLHNYMGLIAYGQGDLQGAAAHFQRAVDLAPDFAEALFNLARTLADPPLERLAEARQHYEQAVRLGHVRHAALEQRLYR